MTRTERLLRLARLRGDRAAELIVETRRGGAGSMHPRLDSGNVGLPMAVRSDHPQSTAYLPATWTEAELRAAWGDR